MFQSSKRALAYTVSCALLLSGCVTTGSNGGPSDAGAIVGPQLASLFETKRDAVIDASKQKLDVIIPVFDPGLSEDAENYKEDGVWPELRRAEANRFAYLLKTEMDKTGAFGAVRVSPDLTATGDLYVLGKILESDGEDVEFQIDVRDISGAQWLTRVFDHEVDEGFHKNFRNENKDPYQPAFQEAANRIAIILEDFEGNRLEEIRRTTELRFGANMNQEAFEEHLKFDDGKTTLVSFPSENDPMLSRTRAIRVRDQLFIDGMQDHYRSFSSQMEASYFVWQEQSLAEIVAQREANLEAAGEAALGILAIAGAVLAIAAGVRDSAPVAAVGAIAGGVIGAKMLSDSFQTSKEAEVHRDALNELGESIDVDLGPRVVEFEQETVSLTGDAKEQFAQWREFLKKIYLAEETPTKQL